MTTTTTATTGSSALVKNSISTEINAISSTATTTTSSSSLSLENPEQSTTTTILKQFTSKSSLLLLPENSNNCTAVLSDDKEESFHSNTVVNSQIPAISSAEITLSKQEKSITKKNKRKNFNPRCSTSSADEIEKDKNVINIDVSTNVNPIKSISNDYNSIEDNDFTNPGNVGNRKKKVHQQYNIDNNVSTNGSHKKRILLSSTQKQLIRKAKRKYVESTLLVSHNPASSEEEKEKHFCKYQQHKEGAAEEKREAVEDLLNVYGLSMSIGDIIKALSKRYYESKIIESSGEFATGNSSSSPINKFNLITENKSGEYSTTTATTVTSPSLFNKVENEDKNNISSENLIINDNDKEINITMSSNNNSINNNNDNNSSNNIRRTTTSTDDNNLIEGRQKDQDKEKISQDLQQQLSSTEEEFSNSNIIVNKITDEDDCDDDEYHSNDEHDNKDMKRNTIMESFPGTSSATRIRVKENVIHSNKLPICNLNSDDDDDDDNYDNDYDDEGGNHPEQLNNFQRKNINNPNSSNDLIPDDHSDFISNSLCNNDDSTTNTTNDDNNSLSNDHHHHRQEEENFNDDLIMMNATNSMSVTTVHQSGINSSAGAMSSSSSISIKDVDHLVDKCSLGLFSPILQLAQMQNEEKLSTENMKKFTSYLECKSEQCELENLREHYHCFDLSCFGKVINKKEEIIRHLKWHMKRNESLNHGFLRFSSSDDCSITFGPNCTHNRKQTHYHCFQPNCDKVYISTSDVQMHSNYHRKDTAIFQEGFQRYRATEECSTDYCAFSGQRTTHFHCRRDNCRFTFKNKADMEKHKSYHIRDSQLARDGFKKYLKTESCPYEHCRFSRICNHIHCVRKNCYYVLHSSGQLLSHKRKHERMDSEQAYRRFKMIQKAAIMSDNTISSQQSAASTSGSDLSSKILFESGNNTTACSASPSSSCSSAILGQFTSTSSSSPALTLTTATSVAINSANLSNHLSSIEAALTSATTTTATATTITSSLSSTSNVPSLANLPEDISISAAAAATHGMLKGSIFLTDFQPSSLSSTLPTVSSLTAPPIVVDGDDTGKSTASIFQPMQSHKLRPDSLEFLYGAVAAAAAAFPTEFLENVHEKQQQQQKLATTTTETSLKGIEIPTIHSKHIENKMNLEANLQSESVNHHSIRDYQLQQEYMRAGIILPNICTENSSLSLSNLKNFINNAAAAASAGGGCAGSGATGYSSNIGSSTENIANFSFDEINSFIRECFTDNCSRQQEKDRFVEMSLSDENFPFHQYHQQQQLQHLQQIQKKEMNHVEIEPLNLKSCNFYNQDNNQDDNNSNKIMNNNSENKNILECFLTTNEPHFHCLIKDCEAIIANNPRDLIEHIQMHEITKNMENIIQNSNHLQVTSVDGFFNRKRGRPPKNRIVEVYNCAQESPQAIFTSFKLEKNFNEKPQIKQQHSKATTTTTNNSILPPGDIASLKQHENINCTQIDAAAATATGDDDDDDDCDEDDKTTAILTVDYFQFFKYLPDDVSCNIPNCKNSKVKSHYHCLKCEQEINSQLNLKEHLENCDSDEMKLLNFSKIPAATTTDHHNITKKSDTSGEQNKDKLEYNKIMLNKTDSDTDSKFIKIKTELLLNEDERISVVRAAGTYFPENSECPSRIIPFEKDPTIITSSSSSSPSSSSNLELIFHCQRPFCKLKRKIHEHCELCNQGFTDKTKLKFHRLKHSSTKLGQLSISGSVQEENFRTGTNLNKIISPSSNSAIETGIASNSNITNRTIDNNTINEDDSDQPQDLSISSSPKLIISSPSSHDSKYLQKNSSLMIPKTLMDSFSLKNFHLAQIAIGQQYRQNPFYCQNFYPFLAAANTADAFTNSVAAAAAAVSNLELLKSQFNEVLKFNTSTADTINSSTDITTGAIDTNSSLDRGNSTFPVIIPSCSNINSNSSNNSNNNNNNNNSNNSSNNNSKQTNYMYSNITGNHFLAPIDAVDSTLTGKCSNIRNIMNAGSDHGYSINNDEEQFKLRQIKDPKIDLTLTNSHQEILLDFQRRQQQQQQKRKSEGYNNNPLITDILEVLPPAAKKQMRNSTQNSTKQPCFKIFKDEPIPTGYLKFRFNEDCNFPNCGYRNHQSHFHCCRNDCYYSFCDKTRFVQHTARHERLDKLMGDDFKQYRANMKCGYENCAYNKNIAGQNTKSSHFHCLKCNFICSDTNKVVAHRRQHSKAEYIRMAGFRKVGNNEKCTPAAPLDPTTNSTPTECSYSLKQTHYHCLICDCSVLSRAQLGSHRHRTLQ